MGTGPFVDENFSVYLDAVIRPCRQKDLPDLEWFGLLSDYRELIQRAYRRQEKGEVVVLVAAVNAFPAGQVCIDLVKKANEGIGVIWAIRVIPPLQRTGIGTRLLDRAEKILSGRGFQWAEIGVDKDNEDAKRLYERIGYQVVDEDRETWSYTTPEGEEIEVVSDGWLSRIYSQTNH